MVVIEIIGSEGKTPRFEKPAQSTIRIGRALDNDIIIDDPYIDAHHLVVDVSEPNDWQATDLDSENGTHKGRHAITTATISSGDELLVGKTRIRLFDVGHHVPPAQSLRDLEHVLLSFDSVRTMIALIVALALLPCLVLYLNSAGSEIKPDALTVAAVSVVGTSLVIAAFWSFVARLLRGESRFRVLFNITMLSALLSSVLRPMIGVVYYNFPGGAGEEVANLLLSVTFMAVYVYVVLLLSTRLKGQVSRIIALVLAVGSIGTYAITEFSNRDAFRVFPEYDGAVYAPVFLLRHGDTPDEFRERLPDVFAQADELAAEDTEEGDETEEDGGAAIPPDDE